MGPGAVGPAVILDTTAVARRQSQADTRWQVDNRLCMQIFYWDLEALWSQCEGKMTVKRKQGNFQKFKYQRKPEQLQRDRVKQCKVTNESSNREETFLSI